LTAKLRTEIKSSVCVVFAVQLCTMPLSQALPQQQELHTPGQEEFNCFSLVDSREWGSVVSLSPATASLLLEPPSAPHPATTCLTRQGAKGGFTYRVRVVGDHQSQSYLIPELHWWEGGAQDLLTEPPSFPYMVYGGRYRVQLTFCPSPTCSPSQSVLSEFLSIQSSVSVCCTKDKPTSQECSMQQEERELPEVQGLRALFNFTFSACSLPQEYDRANLSLYTSTLGAECGEGDSVPIINTSLPLFPLSDGSQHLSLSYLSPELSGDSYYCLRVSLSHLSCRLKQGEAPPSCLLKSPPVWVESKPLVSAFAPFCTSHLSCLWLYISIAGTLTLLVSLSLSLLCLHCCSLRHQRHEHHGKAGLDSVDGHCISDLQLASCSPRSWKELHGDWESSLGVACGESRPRGKILLLYSPDTALFKELCLATKSFLDLACHCDVYDLFDDALFDTIALDPSEWLQEFIHDKDVKVVVISSIGAFRRQKALKGQQPLNLPDNSLLDGLFTSGLRFISNYPGLTSSGRIATARFEMLALTDEEHKLGPPLAGAGVREFLIPTQLHELFCWLHHLQPLDIMGQPWANYQLEMQLLQDALKVVRRDRSVTPNFTNLGNGVTRL